MAQSLNPNPPMPWRLSLATLAHSPASSCGFPQASTPSFKHSLPVVFPLLPTVIITSTGLSILQPEETKGGLPYSLAAGGAEGAGPEAQLWKGGASEPLCLPYTTPNQTCVSCGQKKSGSLKAFGQVTYHLCFSPGHGEAFAGCESRMRYVCDALSFRDGLFISNHMERMVLCTFTGPGPQLRYTPCVRQS